MTSFLFVRHTPFSCLLPLALFSCNARSHTSCSHVYTGTFYLILLNPLKRRVSPFKEHPCRMLSTWLRGTVKFGVHNIPFRWDFHRQLQNLECIKKAAHQEVEGEFRVSFAVSQSTSHPHPRLLPSPPENDLRPSPLKSRASTTPPTSTTFQSRTSCSQVCFLSPNFIILLNQVGLESPRLHNQYDQILMYPRPQTMAGQQGFYTHLKKKFM